MAQQINLLTPILLAPKRYFSALALLQATGLLAAAAALATLWLQHRDRQAERDQHRILAWAMAPGDALAFHFLTLHAAPGNEGATRRRGFSTRWLGDDVRFTERPGVTSPPYPGIGLKDGDPLREDWFPVVWRAGPSS